MTCFVLLLLFISHLMAFHSIQNSLLLFICHFLLHIVSIMLGKRDTNINAAAKRQLLSTGSPLDSGGVDANLRAVAASHGGAARAMLWTSQLCLPHNQAAYNTLNFRKISEIEVATAFRDGASDLLTSEREARAAKRLWGSLVTAEPHLKSIPFIPYLCVSVSRSLPTSPLTAVEVALHLCANVFPSWLSVSSQPSQILVQLDDVLRLAETTGDGSAQLSLWEHMNYHCGASANDYFWLPLQTMFMYTIPRSGHSVTTSDSFGNSLSSTARQTLKKSTLLNDPWQEFFDNIVLPPTKNTNLPPTAAERVALLATQSQRLLYASAIASVLLKTEDLMRCKSRDDIHEVVTKDFLSESQSKNNGNPSKVASQKLQRFKALTHQIITELFPKFPRLMFLTTVSSPSSPSFQQGFDADITPRQVTVADATSNYYPLLKIGALSAHFTNSHALTDTEVLASINYVPLTPNTLSYYQSTQPLPIRHGVAASMRSSVPVSDNKYKSLAQIEESEAELFRSVKNELDTLERMRDVITFNNQGISHPDARARPSANTHGANHTMTNAKLFAAYQSLGSKVSPAASDPVRFAAQHRTSEAQPLSNDVTGEPHLSTIEKPAQSTNTTRTSFAEMNHHDRVPDSVLLAVSMLVKALQHQKLNTTEPMDTHMPPTTTSFPSFNLDPNEPILMPMGPSKSVPVHTPPMPTAPPAINLPEPEEEKVKPSYYPTLQRQGSFGIRSGINSTPLPLHASSSVERGGSEELILRVSRESSAEPAQAQSHRNLVGASLASSRTDGQKPHAGGARNASTSLGPSTTSGTNRASSIPTTARGERSNTKGILKK